MLAEKVRKEKCLRDRRIWGGERRDKIGNTGDSLTKNLDHLQILCRCFIEQDPMCIVIWMQKKRKLEEAGWGKHETANGII